MNIVAMVLQEHAEEGFSVFQLTGNVMTWTVVIFIVLYFVLSKFAFPHILGYAAAREQRIQDALADAQRQREETEQLLAQQRAELANAKVEAQALIAEGKTAADKVRAELIERARAEGDAMVVRARQEIERERTQAIDSLRREAVELAIAAAAKLTGQRLGSAEDKQLVTDFLGTIPSGSASANAGTTGVGAA